MYYKVKECDRDTAALIADLEPVVQGLGFTIVELTLFRRGKGSGKGNAQVRLVVTSLEKQISIGTAELSKVHRAVLPRFELVLEGRDLYLEVSSPGTDRLIKEGAEFGHFIGKALKCWLKGADNWERGVLRGSDKEKILLEAGETIKEIRYETIAKAKLDG